MMNPTVVFRSAVDSLTGKDDGVGTQRRGHMGMLGTGTYG